MIQSINIKNFKKLKDLKINSFGRINLITGTNNSGKSSLLEALSVFISEGNPAGIRTILVEREELDEIEYSSFPPKEKKEAISSLFFNRDLKNQIEMQNSIDNLCLSVENWSFVKNLNGIKKIESIEENIFFYNDYADYPQPMVGFIFIHNRRRYDYAALWDKIILSTKKQLVYDYLKLIEPQIEDIAFIGSTKRKPFAKLAGIDEPQPLSEMGEGVNRMLNIILTLINCQDGYLFIDEFENGIHYSVLPKIWEIIFKISKELNIQVFATTHSRDCTNAFTQILEENNNNIDGKAIKLACYQDQIEAIEFTKEDLELSFTNPNFDIR